MNTTTKAKINYLVIYQLKDRNNPTIVKEFTIRGAANDFVKELEANNYTYKFYKVNEMEVL